MSTGICKSPDSRYWRELYKVALSEIGKSKLLERIAEAEKAVVLRARELFQAAGDNGEETRRHGCVENPLNGASYHHTKRRKPQTGKPPQFPVRRFAIQFKK